MTSNPAPFSTDLSAVEERDNCNYSQRITFEMAENGIVTRKVRVYCDGVYDLFHQGHARQMMQAKNIFPKCDIYLIVGCCNDKLTHLKKGITVLTEAERYEAIRHCRYVDEVLRNAPWEITEDFLHKNKIDFVAQESVPYVCDGHDVYELVKEKGMFVPTRRTNGISTSDIIKRIIKDHDLYVQRNLMRGISAKEMNVSMLTEKRFQIHNAISNLRTWMQQIFLSYFDTGCKKSIDNGKLIDRSAIDVDNSRAANQLWTIIVFIYADYIHTIVYIFFHEILF